MTLRVLRQMFWNLPFRGKMHHVGGMKRERDDDDEVSWGLAHIIKIATHISFHPSRAIQVRKNLEDFNLMAMVQERARRLRAEWRSRWSSLTTSWEGLTMLIPFSNLYVSLQSSWIDLRYTTFSKRKTGIMKKAYELSTLTGTQVRKPWLQNAYMLMIIYRWCY